MKRITAFAAGATAPLIAGLIAGGIAWATHYVGIAADVLTDELRKRRNDG